MTTQKTRSKNLSAPFSRFGWNPLDDPPSTPTSNFGRSFVKREGSSLSYDPAYKPKYFILRNKRKVVSSKGFDTYEQARQALRKTLRKTFQHLFLKSTGAYVGRANGQVSYGAKWTTNPCAFSHLGYTIQKR